MAPLFANRAAAEVDLASPTMAEKLRFLSEPAAYPNAPSSVIVTETHLSFVFLAGDRAFKLKKPARHAFLDFSTLEAREANCREEVRLNRRLTQDVYLGVVALTYDSARGFALGGDAPVIDWLVEMRRLPQEKMLDQLIKDNRLSEADVEAVSEILANFYHRAEPSSIAAQDYVMRFINEQEKNRHVLTRRDFALDHGTIPALLDRLDARLNIDRPLLEDRVRSGHIVDGHGDLRPEHICLCKPIAIFDCLEFSFDLRQVDPFDELTYLGVECALLGAMELGAKITEKTARRLGGEAPRRLISLYAAWRAVLRARLSIAHLLDPTPREPEKWAPLARRYLDLAQQALHIGDEEILI